MDWWIAKDPGQRTKGPKEMAFRDRGQIERQWSCAIGYGERKSFIEGGGDDETKQYGIFLGCEPKGICGRDVFDYKRSLRQEKTMH